MDGRSLVIRFLPALIISLLSAAAQAQGPQGGASTGPGQSHNPYLSLSCGRDETTAIQAALNGTGSVTLPPCPASSPLLVSATLNIPSSTTLRGMGRNMTWLKQADAANLAPMIQNANTAGGANLVLDSNITIQELSIDGNGANQTAIFQNRCIYFTGVANPTIRNVDVMNCRGDAVTYNGNAGADPGSYPATVDHLYIRGTVGPSGVHGWGLAIQNKQRNALVNDVFVENTADMGVYIDASNGVWSNIYVKNAGVGALGTATACANSGTSTVNNPGGGGASQHNWVPCPAGIYFHNITNVSATNITATQGQYSGVIIGGTRHTTISNIISTGNSLASPGTWDDLDIDYNSAIGYGENHGLVIGGARLGANAQVDNPNSINPPTSRYGIYIADGQAGSLGDATISTAGTGYTVGDILSCSGGTQSEVCKFQVIAAPGGVPSALNSYTNTGSGVYTVLPANPVSLTGGSGANAKVNITWSVGNISGVAIGQTVTGPARLPGMLNNWNVALSTQSNNGLTPNSLFATQYANGTIVASTTAQTIATASETTCFGAPKGSQIVPANSVAVGTTFRIHCAGTFTTPAGNAATLTYKIKWGSTVVATSAFGTLASSLTNALIELDADCTVRALGASGSMTCTGPMMLQNTAIAAGVNLLALNTATTIATNADAVLDATLTWSTVAGGQTMTMQQGSIQALN